MYAASLQSTPGSGHGIGVLFIQGEAVLTIDGRRRLRGAPLELATR